ncbi:MAG: SDR family NAD(P)-dependent oxidoreductase, partial [Pseudomonadota bacterium]|nr:SDR family NAD(P)-dependent oxidoreductase [Pseudomonadota bacterium]
MARLDGKIALITGGASGFGAASGKIFAREGAKVVLTDKNADGAQAVAQEIGNAASGMSH